MVNCVAGYLRGSPSVVYLTDTIWFLLMTQAEIKDLQVTALRDYHKGLITRTQLLNIVHLLDRKSFIHST